MTKSNTRRGFTLIELLVVVLIIGILAAVAVPQYQKAVNKAQIARWIPILSQLRRQLDLYVSTEGVFPILLEDIMFEPPQAGSYSENGNLWTSSDGEFGIRLRTNSGGGVNNSSTRLSEAYEAQVCIFFYKKTGRPYLCAPSQSPQNRISFYQPSKKIYCKGNESFCRALGVKKSWEERFDYWEQE